MDEFQLLRDGVAIGPIRKSWEEAAEDAVLAGLAEWVEHDFPNCRAITWVQAGRARIANLQPTIMHLAAAAERAAETNRCRRARTHSDGVDR